RHVGPIDGGRRGSLRRLALSRSVAPQPGSHRLEDMLRLADALGVPRVARLVCPGGVAPADSASTALPAAKIGEQTYALIPAAPIPTLSSRGRRCCDRGGGRGKDGGGWPQTSAPAASRWGGGAAPPQRNAPISTRCGALCRT